MIYLLQTNPLAWAAVVFVVVASIVLHELGHALVATWEGDPTPRLRGHLTWNPVVHMGWLSIGLAAVFGIAWGMTPTNRAYFRHRRWGEALVAAAGPAVNLSLAVFSSATVVLSQWAGASAQIQNFWYIATLLNVALFALNMIPIPPLDGFTVVDGSFGMGQVGDLLRGAGFWPMIVLFVALSRFEYVGDDGKVWHFFGLVESVALELVGLWRVVLPGAA